jgi:hypothetical protein
MWLLVSFRFGLELIGLDRILKKNLRLNEKSQGKKITKGSSTFSSFLKTFFLNNLELFSNLIGLNIRTMKWFKVLLTFLYLKAHVKKDQ